MKPSTALRLVSSADSLPVAAPQEAADLPIDAQIARFLDGETDGQDVLRLLYGAPDEDEAVPERFLALIRNGCRLRAVAG
jgi:hypothetical protein